MITAFIFQIFYNLIINTVFSYKYTVLPSFRRRRPKLTVQCSKGIGGNGRPAGQSLRLSRNTPCSPNKFQNHQGALSRSGVPQAFSATAFSIFTPIALQSWTKSLIVQWWILGVSYQL